MGPAVAGAEAARYRTTSGDYHAHSQMGPGLPVQRNGMHSEMSFRRLRAPDDGSLKTLPTAMHPGMTSSSELYSPAFYPGMPLAKYQFHSEKAVRKALPVDESHIKEL